MKHSYKKRDRQSVYFLMVNVLNVELCRASFNHLLCTSVIEQHPSSFRLLPVCVDTNAVFYFQQFLCTSVLTGFLLSCVFFFFF